LFQLPFAKGVAAPAKIIGAGDDQVIEVKSLQTLLPHLFNEAAKPQVQYARQCMELFDTIISRSQGAKHVFFFFCFVFLTLPNSPKAHKRRRDESCRLDHQVHWRSNREDL